MTTETNTTVQPALLFMPDISGFTEFVNSTEITHAQSIIQEVLEIIVESNQINLEIGEIEGDAIFFYRIGSPPTLEQLLIQVQTMFTKFHRHLQMYDKQRICPCAACTSATQLKLKIVAHFGEVAGYSVKSHHKLFGRDVIVLHRLLKNNLNKKEYALLTNALIDGAGSIDQLPEWFLPEEAKEQYDVGEISFKVADLSKLKENLPEVQAQELNSASRTKTVFTEEGTIHAPAEKVFGAIFDLALRTKWMEGIQRVEMITKDLINRVGTRHRCIVSKRNNPIMVTEFASIGKGSAELVEMDQKGVAGCRFKVEAIGDAKTKLKVDMLVKKNPLLLSVFNLFIKRKMQKQMMRSIENLKEFCKPSFVNPKETITNLN
jgi:carbon monoxide dehydrogenase subunit G